MTTADSLQRQLLEELGAAAGLPPQACSVLSEVSHGEVVRVPTLCRQSPCTSNLVWCTESRRLADWMILLCVSLKRRAIAIDR